MIIFSILLAALWHSITFIWLFNSCQVETICIIINNFSTFDSISTHFSALEMIMIDGFIGMGSSASLRFSTAGLTHQCNSKRDWSSESLGEATPYYQALIVMRMHSQYFTYCPRIYSIGLIHYYSNLVESCTFSSLSTSTLCGVMIASFLLFRSNHFVEYLLNCFWLRL